MKTFKIKSFCKINLFLKVVKKLSNGYHNIVSLITFCNLHDIISISKTSNLNDKISFTGDFKKGINTKSNTATDVLNLLRQKGLIGNQKYKINIQKNIPHGSGLGGGSSNAANLLNYFNKVMKLRLDLSKLEKLASQIGSDVPISLIKKNTFLSGKKGKIQRLKKKFKLNLLIVYPNVICSTKKIYMRNKKISPLNYKFYRNRNEKLINLLKKENNDLIFKEKQSINLDQSKDFNLLKNKFSNLEKENSINIKTINELEIQLDNLVGKLANSKNISSQLSTKNNLLEKELSTLLSKNETFEDKINDLNKKIENQIKEIKKLKDISHHN